MEGRESRRKSGIGEPGWLSGCLDEASWRDREACSECWGEGFKFEVVAGGRVLNLACYIAFFVGEESKRGVGEMAGVV